MAGNITNLIRKDFYALWTEKGIGVVIFIPLTAISPVAPAWTLFTLFYLLLLIHFYSSNIFILEEKYRTAGFFGSLPVRRKDIVLSRYFGIVVLMAVHLLLAYSSNLVFKLAGMLKLQLPPGYFALALLLISILASFSFPFYFKYGATKATIGLTLGFAATFFIFFFAVSKIPGLVEKIRNFSFTDVLTSSLLSGIAILLFVVSIKISTQIYSKRDL